TWSRQPTSTSSWRTGASSRNRERRHREPRKHETTKPRKTVNTKNDKHREHRNHTGARRGHRESGGLGPRAVQELDVADADPDRRYAHQDLPFAGVRPVGVDVQRMMRPVDDDRFHPRGHRVLDVM